MQNSHQGLLHVGGLLCIHIQLGWLLGWLCPSLPLATKLAPHTSGNPTDKLRGSCPGGAHLTAKWLPGTEWQAAAFSAGTARWAGDRGWPSKEGFTIKGRGTGVVLRPVEDLRGCGGAGLSEVVGEYAADYPFPGQTSSLLSLLTPSLTAH